MRDARDAELRDLSQHRICMFLRALCAQYLVHILVDDV
jgi:hypothetical protein